MATQPNDIKVVMMMLSNAVATLAADAAYLRAEHAVLLKALTEDTPALSERLDNLRHQTAYGTALGAHASALSDIAQAVSKIQGMGFDTWSSLLKQG